MDVIKIIEFILLKIHDNCKNSIFLMCAYSPIGGIIVLVKRERREQNHPKTETYTYD